MSINVVIIDGVLDRKFEPRQLENGSVQSGTLKYEFAPDKFISHVISAWGDRAQEQFENVGPGDKILVHGQLRKSSYKKNNEWVERYEVNIFNIEALVPNLDSELTPAGFVSTKDDDELPFA